jgi:hypothetical protein
VDCCVIRRPSPRANEAGVIERKQERAAGELIRGKVFIHALKIGETGLPGNV